MAQAEKNLQPMDTIPVDMLIEIFIKLPAKSLAKFVCVSKLWTKIIRGQDFIRAFSFHSPLQNKHLQPSLLLAFKDQVKGYQEHWYFFSKTTPLYEQNSLVQNINEVVNEEPKPKASDFVSSMVCHLKEMRYQKPSYVHGLISFLYGQEQVICNPSIGKSITLPAMESSEKIIRSFLGYEPIHAQHKVLCLTIAKPFCGLKVLTLGTQNCSWRMVQCSTPHYPGTIYVCIEGVLYYSASTSNWTVDETLLVRFDLVSESLEIVSVYPEGLKSLNETSLINYHGKVAVVSRLFPNYHDFNLWVLEDVKKQLWSKEQHISIDTGVTCKFYERLEISGTSDMGEIIFAPNKFEDFVVIYFLDLKRSKVRSAKLEGNTKHKFCGFYKVFTFLHYIESVMLI
ncbi:F-box protein At1g47810 [Capsella rubella]|uniref:F-box protein At1g47810 n=1 Tax=Capsella rubella TaxID=81985 RepID=UPI000CD5AF8E|nr:F-box protein At1g47810 [Capsella rubella]